jgi:hypothetical protein
MINNPLHQESFPAASAGVGEIRRQRLRLAVKRLNQQPGQAPETNDSASRGPEGRYINPKLIAGRIPLRASSETARNELPTSCII